MYFSRVTLASPSLPSAMMVENFDAVGIPRRSSNQSVDRCGTSKNSTSSAGGAFFAAALATTRLRRFRAREIVAAVLDRFVEHRRR